MLSSLMLADVHFDCKDIAASSMLDALWYAAGAANDAATAGDNANAGQQAPGVPGPQGEPGLSCWDVNGNGVGEPEEDVNGDGNYNALDCQGAAGADGAVGEAGLSCWDLNGNGLAEAQEDINGDGNYNALDCQGADGADGADGAAGEQGAQGDQGAQGEQGAAGLSCWDLNGNGVGDPDEDVNEDGNFDARDCQGAPGEPGLSCWDLNANHVADPEEDINGDGNFDALDCQGPPGEPGPMQVIAAGVVNADGSLQSGSNFVSTQNVDTGRYDLVFDVSGVDIPQGAGARDFPVSLTILSEPDPLAKQPVAKYRPISLASDLLTIRVEVKNLEFAWVNVPFSVQVFAPNEPSGGGE